VARILLEFEATVGSDGIQGKITWTAEAAGRSGILPWKAEKTE
jgi:hypothetical protein